MISASRAALSLRSVTVMPSSAASAIPFERLGCEAIRFFFEPHPDARIPLRSAVPMFPAPITAIFLATIGVLSRGDYDGAAGGKRNSLAALDGKRQREPRDGLVAEKSRHRRRDLKR